jgi:hypothetical protein
VGRIHGRRCHDSESGVSTVGWVTWRCAADDPMVLLGCVACIWSSSTLYTKGTDAARVKDSTCIGYGQMVPR